MGLQRPFRRHDGDRTSPFIYANPFLRLPFLIPPVTAHCPIGGYLLPTEPSVASVYQICQYLQLSPNHFRFWIN
jgi:hypothetical protein